MIKKAVVFCVIINVILPNIYARDNYELHKVDYYAVLGIEKITGQSIEELLQLIHEVVDQKGGNSEFIFRLKNEFGLSFGGAQKHRYIFHWGFNIDLKHHKPLIAELDKIVRINIEQEIYITGNPYQVEYEQRKEKVDKQTYIDEKTEEKIEEILEFINAERAKQNRILINKCMEITGLNRNMSAGLVTILWDIHILSDYLGQLTEGLLDFSTLSIDLRKYGLERLFELDKRDEQFRSKFDKVQKELNNIYSSFRTDRDRACALLNYLCGYSDCYTQNKSGDGAIALLIKESNTIKNILSQRGIVFN